MLNKKFNINDQKQFSYLSGDFNPIHIDPNYSRRSLYGNVVVHGVHLLLWSIDLLISKYSYLKTIENINVMFKSAVYLDEKVTLQINKISKFNFHILIYSNKKICVNIKLTFYDNDTIIYNCQVLNKLEKYNSPSHLSEDEIKLSTGKVALILFSKEAQKLFPRTYNNIDKYQIATLLACTKIVGMKCPGLNSIFINLQINFKKILKSEANEIEYSVNKYNKKFKLVNIKLLGLGIKGEILAINRPEPIKQLSYSSIKKIVMNDDLLRGYNSIIVGGSRGLGELTSKILSAMGSKVIITYSRGLDEAKEVVSDINNDGGEANYTNFNVLDIKENKITSLVDSNVPILLFYFATPFISKSNEGEFSWNKFNNYNDFYLKGLINTIDILSNYKLKGIYSPSTIFIDQKPDGMQEYISSKLLLENLCDMISRIKKEIKIYSPRLPRMDTDQTSEILKYNIEENHVIMDKSINKFVKLFN